jgi:hypothetical protein
MTTILSGSIDPAALRATLERIYAGSAFLRAKQDVRETPFLEYAAVPAEEIVRVHPVVGHDGPPHRLSIYREGRRRLG